MAAKKNGYEKKWKITEVWPGDQGYSRLPMEQGDTLSIHFESGNEARFHRYPGAGATVDAGWETARGVYFEKSGNILGELEHPEKGITTFTISLDPDKRTIRGEHRYNPSGGGWGGHD